MLPEIEALDSTGAMPDALKHRMSLAIEAQRVEGFAWGRLWHLRYLDVPGLRFVPTLGDVTRRKLARWGVARLIALPFLLFPLGFAHDVWAGLDPLWLKLVYSVPIALVFAFGLLLFWGLGPNRKVKIGQARSGLYFTPNLLTTWTVNPGAPDNIWMVPREQVLLFFERSTGTSSPSVWVRYRRANGEVTKRRTGLPGLGKADREWLEHWRTTGEMPIEATGATVAS